MEFRSQICTNGIQSQRLIELGLKKETADMKLFGYIYFSMKAMDYITSDETIAVDVEAPFNDNQYKEVCLSWSLHRLIEMIGNSDIEDCEVLPYGLGLKYKDVDCMMREQYFSYKKPLYDAIINGIEWLIKKGYFNKEYLNEI